jgi:hypothetical protein
MGRGREDNNVPRARQFKGARVVFRIVHIPGPLISRSRLNIGAVAENGDIDGCVVKFMTLMEV